MRSPRNDAKTRSIPLRALARARRAPAEPRRRGGRRRGWTAAHRLAFRRVRYLGAKEARDDEEPFEETMERLVGAL